ncbi:anthranilate phosphoribosyltransferase [Hymenobacter latericus]|uniref:anthranilate phosphoribosyltransferase n=1 Tax=Hymenobacter sp. YIM 151858-1 TaxID=2987688 RepID=UPI00222807C4|nr:anthranilate phosphoribosyltransferase [Hymenobacter sp. YIM 151858-1]UYZ60666.1 anthranilate phosphoribosyltransferase [Hymenobacter sp. YIM 151858-1]
MKQLLTALFEHHNLSRAEAHELMLRLGQGEVNDAEAAALLTVFRMRPITVPELAGFRDALLELCRDPELGTHEVLDIVGTGGDGKETLNISTLASFVVAGAGYKVVKHGNFGVSSSVGASNILAYFGYDFDSPTDRLRHQLEAANICFLHAPAFHPAMRRIAPVRRDLGVRTFFNMLGPLINPARPTAQLLGVYSLELLRLYQYLLQESGTRYAVVHALDGYDELSLTGDAKIATSEEGERLLTATELGLPVCRTEDLVGGRSVEGSARIFRDVLDGKGTRPQCDVVAANAALGICCINPNISLPDALDAAYESLDSGRARQAFTTLLNT